MERFADAPGFEKSHAEALFDAGGQAAGRSEQKVADRAVKGASGIEEDGEGEVVGKLLPGEEGAAVVSLFGSGGDEDFFPGAGECGVEEGFSEIFTGDAPSGIDDEGFAVGFPCWEGLAVVWEKNGIWEDVAACSEGFKTGCRAVGETG